MKTLSEWVRPTLLWIVSSVVWMSGMAVARSAELDGFTEPYRTVNVATTEIGTVAKLEVREGDAVKKGQALARLDTELQSAMLSIAQKHVELRGRIEAARAELVLRSHRLSLLEELAESGHARGEEVTRARADAAIAEAQLLSAEEEAAVRKLEYERTNIQLKRRTVLSPISGVVSALEKHAGEFVAPTDPHLMIVVQLDQLLANFSVSSQQAAELTIGQSLDVRLLDDRERVEGVLEFISPVTDAESGTVLLKIRLDNPDGEYRSGQRCTLKLPAS